VYFSDTATTEKNGADIFLEQQAFVDVCRKLVLRDEL